MNTKFIITLEDGSKIESHDENFNEVADHAMALLPHNNKKWITYELVTDTGISVLVDYNNGHFLVNGQRLHFADYDGSPLTDLGIPQNFENTTPEWSLLNGMNYFPVVGRRHIHGDMLNGILPFAGWKIKRYDKVIEKIVFIFPNGQIVVQ